LLDALQLHFLLLCFEVNRRRGAVVHVLAPWVVEHLDTLEDVLPCRIAGLVREPDFCSAQLVFGGVRNTAAHGGKSEGLQIAFTGNGTRHDGTHHHAEKTVAVDDLGGEQTDSSAALHPQKVAKAACRRHDLFRLV
jgi:hypothetical protein